MADQSSLDKKYFIDNKRYNCPFCNSRSVVYSVSGREEIDWTNNTKAWAYRVMCGGCGKTSLHLSHYKFSEFKRDAYKAALYFQTKPEDQKENDVENYKVKI